jgi:hypothetical protein
MYSTRPGLVLGFHGCDEQVARKVLTGEELLKSSANNYDWLGHGIYFYEGDELYPNAGFREKDHIQICVRNPNCIKGFFLPRNLDYSYPKV